MASFDTQTATAKPELAPIEPKLEPAPSTSCEILSNFRMTGDRAALLSALHGPRQGTLTLTESEFDCVPATIKANLEKLGAEELQITPDGDAFQVGLKLKGNTELSFDEYNKGAKTSALAVQKIMFEKEVRFVAKATQTSAEISQVSGITVDINNIPGSPKLEQVGVVENPDGTATCTGVGSVTAIPFTDVRVNHTATQQFTAEGYAAIRKDFLAFTELAAPRPTQMAMK